MSTRVRHTVRARVLSELILSTDLVNRFSSFAALCARAYGWAVAVIMSGLLNTFLLLNVFGLEKLALSLLLHFYGAMVTSVVSPMAKRAFGHSRGFAVLPAIFLALELAQTSLFLNMRVTDEDFLAVRVHLSSPRLHFCSNTLPFLV